MTDDEIKQVQELVALGEKATQGAWEARPNEWEGHPDPAAARIDITAGVNDTYRRCAVCEPEHSLEGGYDAQPKRNGAFIAASANARPALAALLRERREWLRVVSWAKEVIVERERHDDDFSAAVEGKTALDGLAEALEALAKEQG